MEIKFTNHVLIPIHELKPHPKNRNKHTQRQVDRLADILKYSGVRAPAVVSNQSGFICKGHCTILAAKKNGWEKYPVSFQDFDTPEQEYAYVQADNAIAAWADMDLSAINTDLADLGPDFNIDMLGIDGFKIEVADHCDPEEAPEPRKESNTVLGDLYELGDHRVLCGDATILSDFGKVMKDDSADLLWTDPPYNVKYKGKTKEAMTIENDEMAGEDFLKFLTDAFTNAFVALKPGGGFYIAHADIEGLNFRQAVVNSGLGLRQCLIWAKNSMVMGRQDYHWKHEPILYGWKPGAAHVWVADRKQTTVLEFDRPSRNGEHPTMKPVALIEYCLKNSSHPDAIVLDMFGGSGSGSTLIASERTGRKARCIELDPVYVDVIVSRWCKVTGNTEIKLNGEPIQWEV